MADLCCHPYSFTPCCIGTPETVSLAYIWQGLHVADASHQHKNIQCVCLYRVKQNRASLGNPPAIIAMSLAGPRAASLNDAIDGASNSGITVVVAAGGCPTALTTA